MKELERYQKNFEQSKNYIYLVSTDKENLLQFSQHVYETLMNNNILPDFW